MKRKVELFFGRLLAAMKQNPVEVILALLFCVLGGVAYEVEMPRLNIVLSYFPAFFLISYILNGLTQGKKKERLIYILSIFSCLLFLGKGEGVWSSFWLVTIIVVQLLYLISWWKSDNKLFIKRFLGYLRAVFSAVLLAGIAWLLSISIFYSIQYIFEIWKREDGRFLAYSASIAFIGMLPLLFLMFNQKREEEGDDKLFNVLLNYVLSPALLVYAVILYLYIIKIVVLWSLPKGAVAYIVVSFVAAIFMLKGCQSFLLRRYYDWFYRYASWVVMPALVMYWIGAFYRINQYGFTIARVYLVVTGIILTGITFLFLTRRFGRYLYAALLAVVLLVSVTYIPGIKAQDIERISQTKRGNYPIKTEVKTHYNPSITIQGDKPFDISDYQTIQRVLGYRDSTGMNAMIVRDTFYLYNENRNVILKENANELFARQLEKVGLKLTDSIPVAVYPELLRLDMDSALLVFDEISIRKYLTDSVYRVSNMGRGYYLKKKK
ncbi:DUF4153 domain-containing protein [Parabacteroides sp. AM08-6]|uniref:DUF4153 domain-containing protein n=1 Tax=Parabacteroides sp. AM08-6 TaxID=2292053 RepID=UPI000EFFBAC5|nr:DUF4153 domain-containing protein [Parabacteroides sp. AM08-6]RHJ81832.1 DUF4153 domain-containing protein [Parabacteroides sp. AM08-6]